MTALRYILRRIVGFPAEVREYNAERYAWEEARAAYVEELRRTQPAVVVNFIEFPPPWWSIGGMFKRIDNWADEWAYGSLRCDFNLPEGYEDGENDATLSSDGSGGGDLPSWAKPDQG